MAKTTAGPSVITANRLRDGAVVYLTAAGDWSEHFADALIAADATAIDALQAVAAKALAENVVIDVTAISATLSVRERIRLVGPTVRPDLARV